MLYNLQQIPAHIWILAIVVIFVATTAIWLFRRHFELVELEFPWKFKFTRRSIQSKSAPILATATTSEVLNSESANGSETPAAPEPLGTHQQTQVDEENLEKALRQAETRYIGKLKQRIQRLFASREVIQLKSDVILPEPDQITTEFVLHTSRERITLAMFPSGTLQEPLQMDLYDAVDKHELLVILGAPGAGKSWALGDIALRQIHDYEAGETNSLPLLVHASEWQVGQAPIDFLRSSLQKLITVDSVTDSSLLLERFDADLASGRYLVLIDALNEMPQRRIVKIGFQPQQQTRTNYSEKQAKAYRLSFRQSVGDEREWQLSELVEKTHLTHYVVVCRTLDFEPRTLPWPQAHARLFDADQIQRFVESRMHNLGAASRDMLDELEINRVAKDLGSNPFYLEIMTAIFMIKRELPRRRAELLEDLVNWRLQETLRSAVALRSDREAAITRCHRALSQAALLMLRAGYAGAKAPISALQGIDPEVIEWTKKSGLISLSQPDEFRSVAFYHELIQEYYAALGLASGLHGVSWQRMIRDQRWAEVIALWYEIESVADKQGSRRPQKSKHLLKDILKGLNQKTGLNSTASMPGLIVLINLVLLPLLPCLLAAILVELVTVPGIMLNTLSAYPLAFVGFGLIFPFVVSRFWRAWSLDFQTRTNAAHILAALPHPETAPFAVDELVKLLNKNDQARNFSLVEPLVKLGDFSRFRLRSVLYNGKPHARYLAAIALARIGDTSEAKEMSDIFIGNYATPQKDEPEWQKAIKYIWTIFKNLFSRTVMVTSALQLQPHVGVALAPYLLKRWRQSTNQAEKFNIGNLLTSIKGFIPSEAILDEIQETEDQVTIGLAYAILLKSGSVESVQRIFDQLAQNKIPGGAQSLILAQLANVQPQFAPVLIENLTHPNWEIRRLAVTLLGKLNDPNVLHHLMERLEDERLDVQIQAINIIGELKAQEAKTQLKRLASTDTPPNDEATFNRLCATLYALGSLGDAELPSLITTWLDWLAQQDDISDNMARQLRLVAIESLSRLGTPNILPVLEKEFLSSNDNDVLIAILHAFSTTNDSVAIEMIGKMPYSSNTDVKLVTIETLKKLGKISRRSATRILQSYSSDESDEIRKAAALAINQISPALQSHAIIDLSTSAIGKTPQQTFLHYTGLNIAAAWAGTVWKIAKQQVSASNTQVIRGSFQISTPNPSFDLRIFQESAQLTNDVMSGTTGLQRWGCSLFLFYIPALFGSIGLLYTLNVPDIIMKWLLSSPIWGVVALLSLAVASISIASMREQASTWFVPLLVGLGIGLPIYSLAFNWVSLNIVWWLWLLLVIAYVCLIWLGVRFQWYKKLPEWLNIEAMLLPTLPILPGTLAGLFFYELLETAIENKEGWWKTFNTGVAIGLTSWLIFETLRFYGYIPGWWSVPIMVIVVLWGIFSALSEVAGWVGKVSGWFVVISEILLGLAILPGLSVGLCFAHEMYRLDNKHPDASPDTGLRGLGHWFAFVILLVTGFHSLPLLLGLAPAGWLAGALGVITILCGLSLGLKHWNKAAIAQLVEAPLHILLLPWRVAAFLAYGGLKLAPYLASLVTLILNILPWKVTRFLGSSLQSLQKEIAFAGIAGTTIGLVFAVDMGRRFLSLLPLNLLLFIVPIALIWLATVLISITAYRKKDYISLLALSVPVILPISPFLIVLALVSIAILSIVLLLRKTKANFEASPAGVGD
jgi:HEAT repeat protein